MTIIFLTDSLGLPRTKPESVRLEETYIELLRERYKDHKIINISLGGATIETLREQLLNYYNAVVPDLIFVQSGIVDCAPRALKKWETALLSKHAVLRKFSDVVIKKNIKKIRKHRKLTYTSITRFSQIANEFRKKFDKKLYWIGILPALPEYETQLPGITANITHYNEALANTLSSNFINTSDIGDGIMSDFHHLNKAGNFYIYQKIATIIESNLHS